MPLPSVAELRRGVLAVSVLHDVDVELEALGLVLPGSPHVWVPWGECRRALAGHDPETTGSRRLAEWLRARRWAADITSDALARQLRPVGLPVGHELHPGPEWTRERVLGDALDLGLGALGLDPADPERVVLLPEPALEQAGLNGDRAWARVRVMLEDLGFLAAQRLRRDSKGQLRPLGDCDVVTLMGSRRLRTALADQAGGMAVAVVPMRQRGWTRLALIDPAFGPAAAAATDPAERGFPRPLLITADELTVVSEGGRTARLALRDPVPFRDEWAYRDVLHR